MTYQAQRDNRSLAECLTPVVQDDGAFQFALAPNWMQGRSCYGGMSTAFGLAAIKMNAEVARPLRTVQVAFAGPLREGPASVQIETLRSGTSVEVFCARVMAPDNRVATQVTAVFGAARNALTLPQPQRNDLPTLTGVPDVSFIKGMMPEFMRYIDLKWVGGGVPFSGTKDMSMQMWGKFKQRGDVEAELYYVALADMPPTVMLSHFQYPVMSSSVTWSLEIVRPLVEAVGEWMYIEADLNAASDGYCQQTASFYDEAGHLIMLGRQCIAYFG